MIVFASILVLFLFKPSLARYIYNGIKNYYYETQRFYFNCDKLDENNAIFQLDNWDGVNSFDVTYNMNSFKNNFIASPMEKEADIPNNYFDYIISIFSIGYTSDLKSTLNNAYKYLLEEGSLIISWTHPFYYCLDIIDDKVVINKSYFDEDSEIITKGPDKINLAQKNVMISTMINTASDNGFYLNKLYEEETVLKDNVNGYNSPFWRKEKIANCPSTIIFEFKKKDR